VASHIVHGKYDLGNADQPRMILGAGLESALGVISDLNDYPLIAYLPRKGNTEQLDPLENISIDSVYTSAAFLIQQDFDNKYGITNIDFLKRAMQFKPDEYSGLEISLTDKSGTGQVKNELRQIFGKDYLVLTRYEQNRSLYAIMNVERWVIYSVLCLILVVAAFNMIGALTMLVLEKQKDISILHALGGNQSFIRKIFLSEGLILALVGCGSGMLLALLVAWLQITFHLIPLPGSFLISYYPVKLRVADFVLVGSTVFLIALIASWLPARKAAAQEYALRSE
jgi:lipoprotein-releasing system permease protein